jgi:hypothetical protein
LLVTAVTLKLHPSGAQDPDSAAGVLDDRQDVHPRPGQGDRFQEVAGQQGIGLGM